MTTEKRKHERFPFAFTAIFSLPEQKIFFLRSRNFCSDGAFLEKTDSSTDLPPLGVRGRLTVSCHSEKGVEKDSVIVKVVRVTTDGIGVQFIREFDLEPQVT